jgi:hypothetical protein
MSIRHFTTEAPEVWGRAFHVRGEFPITYTYRVRPACGNLTPSMKTSEPTQVTCARCRKTTAFKAAAVREGPK